MRIIEAASGTIPKENAMTCRGHVKNGVVVLDDLVTLPEGAEVEVHLLRAEAQEPTLGQKLMGFSGKAEGLPADLARNRASISS